MNRKQRRVMFGTCLMIIAGLIFGFATTLPAQDNSGEEERVRIGEIICVSGQPFVKREGFHIAARIGTHLYANDLIKNNEHSRVCIQFEDGSLLNVTSNSELILNKYIYNPNTEKWEGDLGLIFGHIRMMVKKLGERKFHGISVNTPTATLGIRGTEFIAGVVERPEDEEGEAVSKRFSPLMAFNDNNKRVASDATFDYAELYAQAPPDLITYVFCIDGLIWLQNLNGGQEYEVPEGETGWAGADSTWVFEVSEEVIRKLYLLTNIPGCLYGDGLDENDIPLILPPIEEGTSTTTIGGGFTTTTLCEPPDVYPTTSIPDGTTTVITTVPSTTSMFTTTTATSTSIATTTAQTTTSTTTVPGTTTRTTTSMTTTSGTTTSRTTTVPNTSTATSTIPTVPTSSVPSP